MSSSETTKKRKGDGHKEADNEGGTTLAAILAEMKDMKGRLSRMDELERKCLIQEKSMDKLETKCQLVKAECDSLKRSLQILIKEQKWE